MNFLDIRTVLFSQLITDALCTVVLILLWLQNRKRYAGMIFWVIDFTFQTTAALLIILRGSIPDWMSIGLSSPLVLTGALMGYMGLVRFVGKRSSQIHNYLLLWVFVLVNLYFIYFLPNLEARNLNVSVGLFVICFQCAWLMLQRSGSGLARMTRVVGWVFALFCLVSVIRIFIILVSPQASNDFFKSGLYDTLILLSFQILLILLTFGLALMVNRRLLVEVRTQEEKFTKAFHSSPYAILITHLSVGLILDVNRGFEEMTGYQLSEAVGKTTLDLRLWVNDKDREQALAELIAGNEVQGREFQFRAKSGRQLTGLYYAEILVINNEQLVLSSISDITERKQAQEHIAFQANLLANISDVVYATDEQLRLTAWNHAAERTYGWKEEEVLGKPVVEVVHSKFDPELRVKKAHEVEEKGSVTVEIEHETKSGEPAFFEAQTSLLRDLDGKVNGYVSINHDITERKQAEKALRESEEKLEKPS
jgi:PAS domain S-box-containing protein